MKALILAGGKGTRLRPITFAMAKQLVPVANKPVVEYGIEAIRAAGITEFGIIVGDTATEVEATLGDGSRFDAQFTFIPQPEPLGLAHAVATARPFLGEDDFVMYLGDNVIKSSLGPLVDEFRTHRPAATILLTPVPNPESFGVAEMDGDRVVRLEEKPKQPRSDLALVGVYLFQAGIHRVIEQLMPSARGEYEITEAIQALIDQGQTVRSHLVTGWWKDTGTVEAMLSANQLILEDQERRIDGHIDAESEITGRVVIEAGARVEKSIIRGPAIIGKDCLIKESYVGPFTAIDAGSEVIGAEISYSIVMRDAVLREVPQLLEGCLIGRGAKVTRRHRTPRSLSLVLGDQSEIVIP